MRTKRNGRVALVAGAALALSVLGGVLAQSGAAVPGARVTPTRFGIGVQADTAAVNGWMPSSGVPWDYTYRYIGAGLRAGGTYPIVWASTARNQGYTPVFSQYSIRTVPTPCAATCSEAQVDLTNLNTPTVMKDYFADFSALMQRLGPNTVDGVKGFGQDIIIHVEPDLSGYAQSAVLSSAKCFGFCTKVGNDPSLLRASVASSGNADAAAFPDTYRGFNQTLLRMRDKYAPNVRLALHVSNWATLYDLNSATTATLDPAALGKKAGDFAAASGATWTDGSTSTYDLLFNDVSNKDAGQYKYLFNSPRFWDRLNVTFPNFARWESYLKAVTTATKRPAIVWQIPTGNQVFNTMDNTRGHYQDNRAEYFFGHVGELVDIGVVGLLFGSTNADATHHEDTKRDGVTNPPPTCTADGLSTGVVCTTKVAQVADDDGGYLRMAAGSYYQAPTALPTPAP
jgi:hypothetical protein